MNSLDNPTVAIIACCKMEELYIREWIDWHINKIGVDHIYLCDNNDSNYHIPLRSIIDDYIKDNKITLLDYNNVSPIQPMCYTNVYTHYGHIYDWYIIIDIDEFLELPKYNNDIKSFLKQDSIKSYDYFNVFCRIYDDNNLVEYDNRPCNERFTHPMELKDFSSDIYRYCFVVKSIVKGIKWIPKFQEILKNDNFIIIEHQHDVFMRYDNIKRVDIFGNEFNKGTPFFNVSKFYNCDEQTYLDKIYELFYIKHFYTKTIDEYIKYKIYRGDTLSATWETNYPYKLDKFFQFNKLTDEKLSYIENKYPQLYQEYKSLNKK